MSKPVVAIVNWSGKRGQPGSWIKDQKFSLSDVLWGGRYGRIAGIWGPGKYTVRPCLFPLPPKVQGLEEGDSNVRILNRLFSRRDSTFQWRRNDGWVVLLCWSKKLEFPLIMNTMVLIHGEVEAEHKKVVVMRSSGIVLYCLSWACESPGKKVTSEIILQKEWSIKNAKLGTVVPPTTGEVRWISARFPNHPELHNPLFKKKKVGDMKLIT